MVIRFGTDSLGPVLQLKNKGKLVFTNGCFDLLHGGHVQYLKEAAALGESLIIGLNSDDSVRRLKGRERPILSQEERASILTALWAVKAVVIFSQDTPLELIQAIVPDTLVKGGDWSVEQIVGSEFVLKNGGTVKSLPYLEGSSTTGIVERVLERYSG
ncbi:D-glycero-beta-D-manno-heptose 1-phosphate adenylyltransferase [bacterium]|nr:D-glycero-beta-D-manno-heptose 1-phosphate adenylyltransferase [bacterium]